MDTIVKTRHGYFSMNGFHKRIELSSNKALGSFSSWPKVRIEDHNTEVLSCEFNSSGNLFLSTDQDGQIHVCYTDGSFSRIVKMKEHTGPVMEAHFSRDGLEIYSCSADETLGVWDAYLGARHSTLKGHTDHVNCVQGSRMQYPILCSGSRDATVRIWDVRDQACVMMMQNGAGVNATSFDENGEYAFSGGYGRNIKIWDLRMSKVISKLKGHTGSITGLCLSPCGAYLLSHSTDSTLRLWDIRPYATGDRCLMKFPSHGSFVSGLMRCSWSPDGSMVSAGGAESDVFIWDVQTGMLIRALSGHTSTVNDVAFHPTQSVILSAGNDTYLYLNKI